MAQTAPAALLGFADPPIANEIILDGQALQFIGDSFHLEQQTKVAQYRLLQVSLTNLPAAAAGQTVDLTVKSADSDAASPVTVPLANAGKVDIPNVTLKAGGTYEIKATFSGGSPSARTGKLVVHDGFLPQPRAARFEQRLPDPAGGNEVYFVTDAAPFLLEGSVLRLMVSGLSTTADLHVQIEAQVPGQPPPSPLTRDFGAKLGDAYPLDVATADLLASAGRSGQIQLRVRFVSPGRRDGTWSSPQRLYLPDSGLGAVAISSVTRHQNAGSQSPVPANINVYGSYLKLAGSAPNGSRLDFLLFIRNSGGAFEPYPAGTNVIDSVVASGAQWDREVTVPELLNDGFSGRLLVLAGANGQYRFAQPALNVTKQPSTLKADSKPGRPTVSPAPAGGVVFTNGSSALSITVPDAAARPGDAQLVLINNRTAQRSPITAGTAFNWPAPVDGDYQLHAAYVQGDSIGPVSDALTVRVRRVGPVVDRVVPKNLSSATDGKTIRIFFNPENPINAAPFTTAAKWSEVIAVTSTDGGQADFASSSVAPQFSASDNSVKITFATITPGTYEVAIKAKGTTTGVQVADQFGNLLGTTEQTASQDFTFSLIKPLAGDDAVFGVPGLPDATGPPVDYPEYAPRPEFPQGYNPADKVVTRVVQLYYYRDAHRVAQIINRRAHSYNRQNATQARQLADQSRLDADRLIDGRRAAERRAVQFAQKARQAENALDAVQQSLVTARQDQQRIEGLLQTEEDQVSAAQNVLQDAQANDGAAQEALTNLQNRSTQPGGTPPADSELKAARVKADEAKTQLTTAERALRAQETKRDRVLEQRSEAEDAANLAEQRVAATMATVQAMRESEIKETETMNVAQAEEDRAVERQFRLEVAAAHEDPDTYAAGIPESNDPVTQVTVSVINEGVIQLRGPLKGVNIVRTMINQIDAPVGQVRIGVHTVQINGEHGDRMEPVAAHIQRYIDHSRFLTSQSGQMLRNAVAQVASQRAQEAFLLCPDGSQAERDAKYQDAFFGKDFMDELREMDSEFLHTGNKVLSLHSMDTTSLASSLFLLGLASNETRMQILEVFRVMLQTRLPVDEVEYFQASDTKRRFRCREFQFLADNAAFVSLRGFFNQEIYGNDTLNPMQREFIRLAQIFKSRLVTEIEMQQRVLERSLIEERIGDYKEMLLLAKQQEDEANQALQTQQEVMRQEQIQVISIANQLSAKASAFQRTTNESTAVVEQYKRFFYELVDSIINENVPPVVGNVHVPLEVQHEISDNANTHRNIINDYIDDLDQSGFVNELRIIWQETLDILEKHGLVERSKSESSKPAAFNLKFRVTNTKSAAMTILGENEPSNRNAINLRPADSDRIRTEMRSALQNAARARSQVTEVVLDGQHQIVLDAFDNLSSEISAELGVDEKTILNLMRIKKLMEKLWTIATYVSETVERAHQQMDGIVAMLKESPPRVNDAHIAWVSLRGELRRRTVDGSDLKSEVEAWIDPLDTAFANLLIADLRFQFAQQNAVAARRPLDHKKFLDMLIDDVEEKYIELLEGTRSHTAVVDEYVKRIATALDDDFNTQFYEPAFRNVRETSYTWDVQLGQIEQTTILTNNRTFAKVLPQATMEFDLPQRRAAVFEAMGLAEAALQDYGALINDPNFLALTKMFGGQPTSAAFGNGTGTGMVRDVLPGLPSQTDESMLIQADTAGPEFASQVEGLIPDPAIYKFETGTGFEIRPVIQPDGQAVVFHFNYMYSTNVREPVRADEKHLGRIKRHFIDTDVQLGNYELREVSRYRVALKASRTARGVPLLEDVPGLGMLFRPLPQAESSLQQNIILAQATIFPTLFDLMGLRWAPAVADLDTLRLQEEEFVYRKRKQFLRNDVYDHSSNKVDEFLRIPEGDRRPDLYRNQELIPFDHPNGYTGPGLNRQDSHLKEGYDPQSITPPTQFTPGATPGNTAPMIRTPQGQIFEIWDDPQSKSIDSVSPVLPDQPDCPPPTKGELLAPPSAPPADGLQHQSRLDAPSRLQVPVTTQPLTNQSAGRTKLDLGWTTRPVSDSPPPAAPDVSVRQTAPSQSNPERQFRPLPQTERQSTRKLWPFSRKEASSTETERADPGKVDPASYEEPSSPPSGRMRLPVPNFLRRK